jgi:hypothetical protein
LRRRLRWAQLGWRGVSVCGAHGHGAHGMLEGVWPCVVVCSALGSFLRSQSADRWTRIGPRRHGMAWHGGCIGMGMGRATYTSSTSSGKTGRTCGRSSAPSRIARSSPSTKTQSAPKTLRAASLPLRPIPPIPPSLRRFHPSDPSPCVPSLHPIPRAPSHRRNTPPLRSPSLPFAPLRSPSVKS